jgi:hypothetical protein
MDQMFTPWQLFELYGALSLPFTFLIGVVATFPLLFVGKRNFDPRILGITFAPFAISLVGALCLYGYPVLADAVTAANSALHTHRLAEPLRIGETMLPVGTRVTFPEDVGPYVVHAGAGTVRATAARIPLTGDFTIDDAGPEGDAVLATGARIDGVPCTGRHPVSFSSGKLVRCLLSGPYAFAGITFEADTDVFLGGVAEFTIGDHPPSLRLEGRQLEPLESVAVTPDEILVGTPENRPLRTSAGCWRYQVAYDRVRRTSEPDVACPGLIPPDAITL